MKIIKGIENLKKSFRNPVVTLGNFDGVHLGHQQIFKRVKQEASQIRGQGVVITFEPHPLKVLAPERFLPLLTPFRKKMMLIEKSGMETVLCIEFTLKFSEIVPPEFIETILVEKVKVRKVIIGYNYHFGRGQRGDAQTLKEAGKVFDFEVEVVDPLRIGETIVSSSRIRNLIQSGEVEEASKLLGRNYPIIGKVVQGEKRGGTLGFPTANLEASDELYPQTGVYAVEVVWHQQHFDGLANIGSNPTFSIQSGKTERPFSLEVHILDFDQEIYGKEIEVRFKKRIRDEVRFESPSLLIEQIKKDIQWARENVFSRHE
ncbi:MAG TPA: bifunctional riboflavin kinase/FAD synthetase [Thermodesulfobacteriota bacterium]|nr:bifunctional riboflavin kinase/FAD synthetase [Thermodesulfobacteriota bacterium]